MKLFINACVREASRTRRLAGSRMAGGRETYREVWLPGLDFPLVDEAFINWRIDCVQRGDYSSPVFDLAKDFAAAEEIVVAAPFWDLSFPATLKQYFEQVCVLGLTFYYGEDGEPRGLCHAKKLIYVTTAGGPIYSPDYGYGYVRALATTFFGIKETELVKVENLDIVGADVEALMNAAMNG